MAMGEEIVEDRIAYTYKISDSTVESHIKNIYEKLSPFAARYRENLKNIIRKRDKIKFLIAKSDKKPAFERYCQELKAENLFLKHLDRIFQKYASLMNFRETITCQVKYWNPLYVMNNPFGVRSPRSGEEMVSMYTPLA